MRKAYPLLLLVLLFNSCKNNTKNASSASELTAAVLTRILGSFVGSFGDNKITLLITKADKGLVEGRSIVAGNNRPFSGTIKEDEGVYIINAKEPGDDTNDGMFAFKIASDNPDVVEG